MTQVVSKPRSRSHPHVRALVRDPHQQGAAALGPNGPKIDFALAPLRSCRA